MANLLRMKFTQNDDLQQFLLETGEKSLHEASNNEFWATGAKLSSKTQEAPSWNGLDMLGNLLMDLRWDLGNGNQTLPLEGSIKHDRSCNDTELLPMPKDDEQDHGNDHNISSIAPSSGIATAIPLPSPPLLNHLEWPAVNQTKPLLNCLPPPPNPDTAKTETQPVHSTPKAEAEQPHSQPRTTADYFSQKSSQVTASSQTEINSSNTQRVTGNCQ